MKGKNEELFNRMLSNKINKRHFYNSTNEKRNNNFIEEFDFKKTLNTLIINVDGERPLILFKKSPSPMKLKKSEILKNNYMSDGGMKRKSKKFFNLISNYSCKKQSKKESIKEKAPSNNLKNKKNKSFSVSNKKLKKNKRYFFENEIKETNLIKNKSKGNFKYNLFLQNKKNNSEKKKISKQNIIQNLENIKKEKKIDKRSLINNITKMKTINQNLTKNQVQKFYFMGKKLEYLKSNNIDISKSESNLEKAEEKIEKENSNSKKKKNTNMKKTKSDLNTNTISDIKQKPIIDQFEYIKKINIMHNKSSKMPKVKNIYKYYNLIKNKNTNSPKCLNIITYNNKKNSLNNGNSNDDGYLFSQKKNLRKKEELKIYTQARNSKEKKEKEEEETEKSKKIYNKFKNLYKLNIENINFLNKQNIRKTLNIKSQNNELSKKRRVRNKYYIGIDGSKNNSTFIEPKEYYMTLYQSRQIITNQNIEYNDKENIDKNEFIMKEDKQKKKKYKQDLIKSFIKKFKMIFQKKVFVDLYIMYFKNKYYNHYFLSFKFFIAIIKKYAFKKICLNYMSRKKEANKDKKVAYLVEILSLIFKMKVFEKIFIYCQHLQIKTIKENIEKIIKSTKKIIFHRFLIKIKNNNKIKRRENNNEIKNIKNNNEIKRNENNNEVKKIKNNNEIKKVENNEEIKEVINEEISDEINEELNENENIINNNLDNIYADKLKEVIDEINNTDEKNIKFKNTNKEYNLEDIKNEIKREQIHKDANINYINIIINNNINNVLKENENDISDDKDINKGKFWDSEPEEKLGKDKLIINNPHEKNKNAKEFDELLGEIKQMKSYSECSGLVNESKSSKENNNNNKNEIDLTKTKPTKVNKNVNISLKKEIKVFNIKKGKDKQELKLENSGENSNKLKDLIKENNLNKYVDEITDQIVKYICDNEITYKDKLIPKKSNVNTYTNLLNQNQNTSLSLDNTSNDNRYKDLNSLGIEDKVMNDSKSSLDRSLIFSSSIYSIFNKTISERKKELNENFFIDKIMPKIIKIIKEELIAKYELIFNYILTPIKINTNEFSLFMSEPTRESIVKEYKNEIFKENIEKIFQRKIILNKFNQIINEMRNKYCLETDIIYDQILNECIFDSLIELIKKEKLFFILNDKRFFPYEKKYNIQNQHNIILYNKKKFADYICKHIISLFKTKLGKKPEEIEILDEDKIKEENEIKINREIKKEILDKDMENDTELNIEQTKVKFSLAEGILDILAKETIEILENIQYSRKIFNNNYNSNIYQNDNDLNENDNYYGDSEDDIINY